MLAFMSHVIFYNENHGFESNIISYWMVLLISIAEAIMLWEANRLVLLFFRNRYPMINQTSRRIIYQVIGCTLATIIIRYLTIWFYDQTMFWGYLFPPEGYLYNIFVGLLYVFIIGAFYEGYYYFRAGRKCTSKRRSWKKKTCKHN
jgi:hypothetical protein